VAKDLVCTPFVSRKYTNQLVQPQRKRNKPSTASKNDPNKDTSLLELQLDGKNLTDDGLIEVAKGFENVLISTNGVFHTRLQVLNISSNNLTVKALAALAASLRAASNDLEDLDLSGNSVSVVTTDDAMQWETFLMALEDCHKLRRLNLDGNNLNGSLPFETLTRTYAMQCRRNASARWHLPPFDNQASATSGLDGEFKNLAVIQSENRGLPGINNIILTNTAMTDQGALFLTYILEHHVGGTNLDDVECSIDFMPNEQLGPVGTKILKHASNMYDDGPGTVLAAASENVFRSDIPTIIPSSRYALLSLATHD